MGVQTLQSLNERHLEAARLVALGKQNAQICEHFEVSCRTVFMWKRSERFRQKVAEYQRNRDEGLTRSFEQSDSARDILKSAELDAVEQIVKQMRTGDKPLQRYQAAIEILKLLGYYATPKSGRIVINISAADRADMAEGRKLVQIDGVVAVDDSHALPAPDQVAEVAGGVR